MAKIYDEFSSLTSKIDFNEKEQQKILYYLVKNHESAVQYGHYEDNGEYDQYGIHANKENRTFLLQVTEYKGKEHYDILISGGGSDRFKFGPEFFKILELF